VKVCCSCGASAAPRVRRCPNAQCLGTDFRPMTDEERAARDEAAQRKLNAILAKILPNRRLPP
jgi:hypothetical protein